MSIPVYSRIDPAILSGFATWGPGSIAAGANNAVATFVTLPAPLVDSILMGQAVSNYGFGAANGSVILDIVRADNGGVVSSPGGTLQTVAGTTYTLMRNVRIDPVSAGQAISLQARYTTNTTNSYFSMHFQWLMIPKNVGPGQ